MHDAQVLDALDNDLGRWSKNCHAASHAIVCSVAAPENARVARGFVTGVASQHSWVVLGDPYDYDCEVIDATLWSYRDEEPRLYRGRLVGARLDGEIEYVPHGGRGVIWEFGMPIVGSGDRIVLGGLSGGSRAFLSMISSDGLDVQAWHTLLNGPIRGWPAAEIVDAAYREPRLRALIPIDVVGMLTDLNPGGMYMRRPEAPV